jgi:hypothetical protein
MIKYMRLVGLLYMIFVMIVYFTNIEVFTKFEEIVGREIASVILIIFSVSGFLTLMSLMKRSGSGKISSGREDCEGQEGPIDFSKHSPTVSKEEAIEVKPIDLTGNVFEHNFETMEEDLDFLNGEAHEENKNDKKK